MAFILRALHTLKYSQPPARPSPLPPPTHTHKLEEWEGTIEKTCFLSTYTIQYYMNS